MSERPAQRAFDHTLLVVFVAVFIFNSPLTSWWAAFNWPWYSIFIPWAGVIGLTAINQLRQPRDRHQDGH